MNDKSVTSLDVGGVTPAPQRPSLLQRLLMQEDLNFLLTNRVPRIALTRFMGWFSRYARRCWRGHRSPCGGSSPTST
jgi:hypothetical protein